MGQESGKENIKMRLIAFSAVLISLLGACSLSKKAAFNDVQIDMIMSGSAELPMRVYKITNESDSILLRKKSEYVEADTSDLVLHRLTQRMLATVTDSSSLGVGIAAPQVGILKQIILVQRLDKPNMPFETYLNPVIREYSERKRPCREGCLSIPGRMDTTQTRSYEVLVEYDLMDGSHRIEKVEDFVSVIFQHEIDHLNGILYLDHLKEEVQESIKR